ncbi:MAG TPA: thiamine pyrophosphate-binding protein [bacterium]|nr:thiamine pyrophosphate-binding protein [bacterium]
MAELIAGELLMECIANQGPAPIFSIPDGTYNIIFSWAHDHAEEREMTFVTPRHEAAGVHMADAFARVTGRPAVTVLGAGPGSANGISGVICAYCEEIPMIVVTTTRRSDLVYPPRGGMQVYDQKAAFESVCKYNARITNPERIPEIVATAYKEAMTGIPGPVHIEIPEDIMNSKVDVDTYPPTPKVDIEALQCGADPELIEKAAKMLVESDEPMIHAGAAVQRTGCSDDLVALAEYLGCPVTTSPGARGAISEYHPNSIHTVCGMARAALSQAKTVLAIGAKFGELDFFGKPPLWGPPGSQVLIHNHIAPERIGMNKPADLALVGSAPVVLKQLLAAVKKLTDKREPHPRLKQYKDLVNMWEMDQNEKAEKTDNPMITGRAIKIAREFFPKDSIYVMDGGNTSLWSSNYTRIGAPRSLMWTSEFGHLGTGLPFAIGAKLAAPDKQVCLISGDSAFGFNIQALETARRLCTPFVAIVAVDTAWGMEKTAQERCFGHKDFYVNCVHHEIRYDKIAQAMDCFGAYAKSVEEFKKALQDAVDSKLPAVIHLEVDVEANIYPPGTDLWSGSHKTK